MCVSFADTVRYALIKMKKSNSKKKLWIATIVFVILTTAITSIFIVARDNAIIKDANDDPGFDSFKIEYINCKGNTSEKELANLWKSGQTGILCT